MIFLPRSSIECGVKLMWRQINFYSTSRRICLSATRRICSNSLKHSMISLTFSLKPFGYIVDIHQKDLLVLVAVWSGRISLWGSGHAVWAGYLLNCFGNRMANWFRAATHSLTALPDVSQLRIAR